MSHSYKTTPETLNVSKFDYFLGHCLLWLNCQLEGLISSNLDLEKSHAELNIMWTDAKYLCDIEIITYRKHLAHKVSGKKLVW